MTSHLPRAAAAMAALVGSGVVAAAPFENLDFEQADVSSFGGDPSGFSMSPQQIEAVFPHWTLNANAFTVYNTISLGSTSISMHDATSVLTWFDPNFDGPLQGTFSLAMQTEMFPSPFGEEHNHAWIAQTAIVPSDAWFVEFLMIPPGGILGRASELHVLLDGSEIALEAHDLGLSNGLLRMRGDVTAYAGTERELKFELFNPTSVENLVVLDDIRFVVPEASSALLAGLALIGVGLWRRWRR